MLDGIELGILDGTEDGIEEGILVGETTFVGVWLGMLDGSEVGMLVGTDEGSRVSSSEVFINLSFTV